MKRVMIFFLLTINFLLMSVGLADRAASAALWTSYGDDATPVLVMNEKFKMVSVHLTEKNTIDHSEINIKYPQIMGVNLNDSAKHFNQKIKNLIKIQLSDFKNNVLQSKSNEKLMAESAKSYLTINYEMANFASESQHTEFVSLRFGLDEYVRGMAHPYHQTLVFNYDLGHDRVLELADLFKPNSAYLKNIANYSGQVLRKKNPENVDMINAGTSPTQENFKNWNFTLSGLLITFDEAEVGPRYLGVQQVLISRDEIEHLMSHQAACTLQFVLCDKT